jgi:hypothetical protein
VLITPNLVAWQYENYPLAHTTRANLLLHVVTEPLFVFGLLSAPGLFATGNWIGGLVSLGFVIVAAAAQGRGHKIEPNPPLPFQSPLDVGARLVTEQFVTFPRFVLSGGWSRAWRAAGA